MSQAKKTQKRSMENQTWEAQVLRVYATQEIYNWLIPLDLGHFNYKSEIRNKVI